MPINKTNDPCFIEPGAQVSAQWVQELQNATELDGLWQVFLNRVKERTRVLEGHLMYRAGLLMEKLDYFGAQIITKPLEGFPLANSRQDFELEITPEKVYLFKQEQGQMVQMELALDVTVPVAEGFHTYLCTLAPLFAAQFFLLLQIKNYEFNAIKDDITLAYNQNYLKAFMYNEIERAKRYATTFSVVFFDLDNLKAINELYGHLVGTEVLKEVALILRSQVRKVDLLSRFGGDEFVIVLLHAEPARALDICRRIQKAINHNVFMANRQLNIKITGCFGISSFPDNGTSVEELIEKADMAMYSVKRRGKDGIQVYGVDPS